MSRKYINGISNLSFDGKLFSFSLDDTYQNKNQEVNRKKVVEIISDLNTVESIAKFLLKEVTEIKETIVKKDPAIEVEDKEEKIVSKTRLKLKVLKHEHLD